MTFDNSMNAPFDDDEPLRFGAEVYGGNGNEMSFGMGVVSRDFGNTRMNVETARMFSARP